MIVDESPQIGSLWTDIFGNGAGGTSRIDPTGGGFVGGKAPGQVEFENIVRALPKCASEADLTRALFQAYAAFAEAPRASRNALSRAANNPGDVLKTIPGGVYCVDSPQRKQVYKAISDAFQGHAVDIGVADQEKKNLDELINAMDPTGSTFWNSVWGKVKPFVYVGAAGLGIYLGLRIWGAAKTVRRIRK